MTCSFCSPSGSLTGPRCPACQQVYRMHMAAEEDEFIERVATRWIERHARGLRVPWWTRQTGTYQECEEYDE